MTLIQESAPQDATSRPNGSAAAAILAAGIGSMALAILTIAADHSPALKALLTFYKPTGPLSGVTTTAVVAWVLAWFILDRLWFRRDVSLRNVNIVSIVLLVLSLLATFPPIGDLF
jgi:hypothetical protein